MKAEVLLSEKFVEFSEKIKELHDQKKRVIEKAKKDVAAIDQEAVEAHAEFQQWENSKDAKTGPTPAATTPPGPQSSIGTNPTVGKPTMK